jgi:hypothetical protein
MRALFPWHIHIRWKSHIKPGTCEVEKRGEPTSTSTERRARPPRKIVRKNIEPGKPYGSDEGIAIEDLVKHSGNLQLSFPSAGDIEFAAKNHVKEHYVFTPYVGFKKDGQYYVTNPGNEPASERVENQLNFSIINAHDTGVIEKNQFGIDYKIYQAKLVVRIGDQEIWSHDKTIGAIATTGGGNMGRTGPVKFRE